MPEVLIQYQAEIMTSIIETAIMVGVSILAAVLVGLPIGTLLFLTSKDRILENKALYNAFNLMVNIIRSFPFLLLLNFRTRKCLGIA